jgi:uncharacterized small protein (DUF1192 family)
MDAQAKAFSEKIKDDVLSEYSRLHERLQVLRAELLIVEKECRAYKMLIEIYDLKEKQ